ncbi:hypothetical protein [Nocardioides sp. LML1-1-1.1]|uniref:hypothetical protein n=1 Tax=Nocardioides sp. LML1-1-1.1 TaxID=3135248 RepID=UPI0034331F7C
MRLSGSRIVLAGTALLVLAVGLLAGWAALRPHPPGGTTPAAPPAARPPVAARVGEAPAAAALAVLREWDRARAAAWERGDPVALRSLYVPGSRAGRADVAMLRRWQERGLRVRGMRMQVLAVAVRARGPDRVVLVVTDRLVGAVAVPGALPLPRDQPTTRRLELRRVGGRWLLAGAVPLSRS